MTDAHLLITQSNKLNGTVELAGAKNAVLAIMASTILADGACRLTNVPDSHDVHQMKSLLEDLGALVHFDVANNMLDIDTSMIATCRVRAELMRKMRASVLVMGPLLARFGKADIALPGGCVIGSRPIDFHLQNFEKMGVTCTHEGEILSASAKKLLPTTCVMEYPSVGATENILMAAVLTPGTTQIINAAIEPEVLDLIDVLKKMGANITVQAPATIVVVGVSTLKPVEHAVMCDRLEAGSLLLAAAITGGQISLPQARAQTLDVFLLKLSQMGHTVTVGHNGVGISLKSTSRPKSVSFRTTPFPGFPTDLQGPMMAAQCLAEGTSVIHESVFENRFLHVRELQKMGAQINVVGDRAYVTGVEQLYGADVIASDIRAGCALVLAGLAAHGTTRVTGIHHLQRGYQNLDAKLRMLGASVEVVPAFEGTSKLVNHERTR